MMGERVLPDWAHEDQQEVVWLDDDHAITWASWPGEDEPHGGVLWHRKPDDSWCAGSWFLRAPLYRGQPVPRDKTDIWTLESREPLTLSPSFLCHCGHHGWICNGTWVAA
jgi:hypothetical protein